jgi:hypothetical protein
VLLHSAAEAMYKLPKAEVENTYFGDTSRELKAQTLNDFGL